MALRGKQWSELNTVQKIGFLVLISVQMSLFVAALVDLRRRPADQLRGTKGRWVAAAFVNFIGPIAYFIFGRKR